MLLLSQIFPVKSVLELFWTETNVRVHMLLSKKNRDSWTLSPATSSEEQTIEWPRMPTTSSEFWVAVEVSH